MKGLFQVCESNEQNGEVLWQWTKSYPILVYKGKGDVLMVDKHRGVRLLEQDMKVYKKTLEKWFRDIVKVDEKQFGFQSGKSTADALFVLQQLQCLTALVITLYGNARSRVRTLAGISDEFAIGVGQY